MMKACRFLLLGVLMLFAPLLEAQGMGKHLAAFDSDAELQAFFKREVLPRWEKRAQRLYSTQEQKSSAAPASAQPTLDRAVIGAPNEGESITNVQHAGVDEGGIVKTHGKHLVVLRRGRLFSLRIDDRVSFESSEEKALSQVSMVNAYGPDINPEGTWYDEMLISGDHIFVIGYSYSRGGTELGLFKIDKAGKLTYLSTYHLRSADYYSANNSASRVVDGDLIFYTPLSFYPQRGHINELMSVMPAMRRWRSTAKAEDFKPIVAAKRIYKPLPFMNVDEDLSLHTVTRCKAVEAELSCQSTVIMGPRGRVFYVSPQAVYIWVTGAYRARPNKKEHDTTPSVLYRLPLSGEAPTAVQVTGSPVDQFSFLETGDGLNVLVGEFGGGEGMWNAQRQRGRLAFLTLHFDDFSDGLSTVASEQYRVLPGEGFWGVQNRYIGNYLLYSTDNASKTLYVLPWNRGNMRENTREERRSASPVSVTAISLKHAVERIEALGKDALIVGGASQDLYFSLLALGETPTLKSEYLQKGAAQGEGRSHGFFYKPDGEASGILGIPILSNHRGNPEGVGAAALLFLENKAASLSRVGELRSSRRIRADDGCVTSCVDWYGNARPLFLRNRIFALLGYELVEGYLGASQKDDQKTIEAVERLDFAPRKERRQ